jgi:hypothetical protein
LKSIGLVCHTAVELFAHVVRNFPLKQVAAHTLNIEHITERCIMPRPLDEILGLKKTAAVHDLKEGDVVRTNQKQHSVRAGRTGTIVDFDKYNLAIVRLDGGEFDGGITLHFHHSYLEKI